MGPSEVEIFIDIPTLPLYDSTISKSETRLCHPTLSNQGDSVPMQGNFVPLWGDSASLQDAASLQGDFAPLQDEIRVLFIGDRRDIHRRLNQDGHPHGPQTLHLRVRERRVV